MNSRKRLRMLVFAALTVSMCFVLSQLKLFRLPQGGSVSLEALPLVWMSNIFGCGFGISVGSVLGLLRAFTGGYVLHPLQFVLDYPVAFGLLGLSGMFAGKKTPLTIAGIFLAFGLRYISHVIAGVIFFTEFVPAGKSPIVYALVYNTFLMVEFIIVLQLWLMTHKKVAGYFQRELK